MIKRVIFDLDDTLIEWKEEYWNSIRKALITNNIKYTENDIQDIKDGFDKFESKYNMYKKESMLECINEYTKLNLDMSFLESALEEFSKCIPEKLNQEVIDTIEYLYKKYELVVLTNWFKKEQEKRLEALNIRKYFKQIYTPQEFPIKPNKEAFLIASENKIDECIMVGDSLNCDIKGALNAGMKAIYINKNGQESKDYITIKEFSQLKQIL